MESPDRERGRQQSSPSSRRAAEGLAGRAHVHVHGTERIRVLAALDGAGDRRKRAVLDRASPEEDDYCRYIFSVIRKIEVAGNTDRVHAEESDRRSGGARRTSLRVCGAGRHARRRRVGSQTPLASAGPYYADTHVFGQQVVLLRNPNYGGTRPQKLDAIVFKLGYSSDAAVRAVESGEADLVVGEDPSAGLLAPDGPREEVRAGRRGLGAATTSRRPRRREPSF